MADKPSRAGVIRKWTGFFHQFLTHSSPLPCFHCRLLFLKPPQCPYLRFMGMRGAIVTTNPGLKSFGAKLGLTLFPLSDSNGPDCTPSSCPL